MVVLLCSICPSPHGKTERLAVNHKASLQPTASLLNVWNTISGNWNTTNEVEEGKKERKHTAVVPVSSASHYALGSKSFQASLPTSLLSNNAEKLSKSFRCACEWNHIFRVIIKLWQGCPGKKIKNLFLLMKSHFNNSSWFFTSFKGENISSFQGWAWDTPEKSADTLSVYMSVPCCTHKQHALVWMLVQIGEDSKLVVFRMYEMLKMKSRKHRNARAILKEIIFPKTCQSMLGVAMIRVPVIGQEAVYTPWTGLDRSIIGRDKETCLTKK